jgi:hypothetical protein
VVVLTLQGVSPEVSTTNVPLGLDCTVIRHAGDPVFVFKKPVPVTVTLVAGAPGEPPIGGEPLILSSVIAGRTLNEVDEALPPVSVIVTV